MDGRNCGAWVAARAGEDGAVDDAFFRTVLGSLPDAVFVVDESGTIVFANAEMAAVLGYPPAELTGQPLSTIVPEQYARYHTLTRVLTADEETGLDGTTVDVPATHSDGRSLRLSVSFATRERDGRPLLIGTIHDAVPRDDPQGTVPEEASQAAQFQAADHRAGERSSGRPDRAGVPEDEVAQYERIIETIDDGIYVLDENFTITNVNEAVVSMTGYSKAELIGSHASLLAGADLIQQAAELSAELLDSSRETGTIVSEIVTKDGDRLPIETRFSLYTFADDSHGHLGVVRDISDRKAFESTLKALHGVTRELLATDSKPEVSTAVVEAATDVLALDTAAVYRIDADENVLRPSAVAGSPDGSELPTLTPDVSLPWRVFVDGDPALIDDGTAGELLPIETGLCVPLGDHGVFLAGTAESEVIDDDVETLVGLLAASAEEALSRLDREIAIRKRDRRLESRNRRLRQLDRVNAIIREIDQSLVEAESIDGIGDAVCDRLVAADRFAFAWFGEPNPADGTITPRSWSGEGLSYLDDVDFSLSDPQEPTAIATASGEPTVVSDVASDLGAGDWRKAALAREYGSVLAIPLTLDDITHGVLAVYATEPGAFDEMRAVFGELGETIANAMNAVQTRRALLTDSHTELRFRLDADDTLLGRLARRTGGPIDIEAVVPGTEDGTRLFFLATDDDPDGVRDVQAESVAIESISLVAQREGRSLFETVVSGETLLSTLADWGAMVRSATVSGGEIRLGLEIPDASNVRQFVSFVRSECEGAELISKTDRDRPIRTPTEFQYEFEERLTDRQLEVLRVAFHHGFFEWPRESTGQEVADALGVSQPTVNRHLRACERKLFTMLFGEL